MQASDERLGIVRLSLPDGRAVPLQLTYAALDAKGHDWLLDQFKAMQKGKAGAQRAMADTLEVLTHGELVADEVMSAPVAEYPLASVLKGCWQAWELAQYGPQGRPAADGSENPQKAPRKTLWGRIFKRP
ncbi:hypothetical protein [Brevundimonas sp.]|uniref:hypothetical protein n=1 Tax=Brevundimonas sp. TaxID=1871086 RepID=UPI002898D434|nr:hypothetical protein [Brevundimonas sp.]